LFGINSFTFKREKELKILFPLLKASNISSAKKMKKLY